MIRKQRERGLMLIWQPATNFCTTSVMQQDAHLVVVIVEPRTILTGQQKTFGISQVVHWVPG